MKQIAIVYQSKYGQTAKIARHMHDHLLQKDIGVRLLELKTKTDDPVLDAPVDAVIVGGPVYALKYSPLLIAWTKKHLAEINRLRSAFFSVSLNAADKRPASRSAAQGLLMKFIEQSGMNPTMTASFSGALKYSEYNWFIRLIMKQISRSAGGPTNTNRDYEMTDWEQIDRFIDTFIAGAESKEFPAIQKLELNPYQGVKNDPATNHVSRLPAL